MRNHLLFWVRLAVLGTALCLVSAGNASAQFGGDDWTLTGPLFGPEALVLAAGYMDLILAGVPFLVGQCVTAARGTQFPPFWAWTELVLVAAPTLGTGIAALAMGFASETAAAAVPLLAFGSWFATHAIVSLVHHYRTPRADAASRGEPIASLTPGGVLLGYAGRF